MTKMRQWKRIIPLLIVGGAVFGGFFWLSRTGERVAETPVKVVEAARGAEPGLWVLPKEAVAEGEPASRLGGQPFVARLAYLRAERVPVKVESEAAGRVLVRTDALARGDLVVLRPGEVAGGEAVAPLAGVGEERLVGLVIEAGLHAVESESVPESVRFVSPGYRDAWGYNIALLRQVFKRAYKEFDHLKFELAAPPHVNIEGDTALVQTEVRLKADYRGRRNYLLGGDTSADRVILRLDKKAYGWKIGRIEGLRPLGFEERFFRLLGREVGLPLTEEERLDKEQTCARCRQRMNERFGGEPPRAGSGP